MYLLPAILILPYFFLFLKISRGLLKIRPFSVSTSPSTKISVIIACRNEQEKLPALLDAVTTQDYPQLLYEIIIIDDNSTDKTFETASDYHCPFSLIVLKNKGSGKKQALRTGIDASSGTLIITTDADCRMGKNWVKTIAGFFEKYSPDMIIGPVKLDEKTGIFGRFQELEYLSLQGITAGTALAGNGIMCNGANLAFTGEVFRNHKENLHPEVPSGDDVFLLHSLKKEVNSKIMWLESSEAIVTTASSPTLRSFLEQRKRWISKWKFYNDRLTTLTGIVTISASLLQLSVLVAIIFNSSFLWTFTIILILKSVPDFLILRNTTVRYGNKSLMSWFLPSQLLYPLYAIVVGVLSLMPVRRNN